MRIGQNPAKAGLKARKPKRLGVGIITYVPNQTGYFAESLQIIKIEIASLRQNTSEDFDLYVFDNASCPDVQNELIKLNQRGVIDGLMLSHHNIGKIGAMNWLMASMKNEWIMYSDSDFFFRPGWLEESMKLADAFPEAGMITAQPNIYDQLEGKSKIFESLNLSILQIDQEKLDPAAVEEYCAGIGATGEMRQKFLEMKSTVITHKPTGTKAIFGACTAQFMGRSSIFDKVFPLPSDFIIAREEDNNIVRKIEAMGWLEISTMQPYVVHMGNHLDETLQREISLNNLDGELNLVNSETQYHKTGLAWKILVVLNRNGVLKKFFKRLYINLFELYSIEKK